MTKRKAVADQNNEGALRFSERLSKFIVLKTKVAVFNTKHAALRLTSPRKYHEIVFTGIFEKNKWGGTESRSGTGSTQEQTGVVRSELLKLFADLEVRRFLDIPCGDFRWMKEVNLPLQLIYIGGDIVDKLIDRNKHLYGGSNKSFRKLNLVSDNLPKCDLVLCRDCLVHFSQSDIVASIRNLKMSGSTYILTTHFTSNHINVDIKTGAWRPINLTRAPFNFPTPVRIINEGCTEAGGEYRDKCLALWRLKELSF